MESKHYEQLHLLREHWRDKGEIESLSEDELIELADLYETDAEFQAFCDADQELQDAVSCLAYFIAPIKRMREYFYKFRDFCYGKGERPDSPDRILSFYQIEGSSFKKRCDADPVARAVIERWFRNDDPDPNVRSLLGRWLSKNTGNASNQDVS